MKATYNLSQNFKIFSVHFPGNPMLPGSLLVDFAAHMILDHGIELSSNDVWDLKFIKPILPGVKLEFILLVFNSKELELNVKTINGLHATIKISRKCETEYFNLKFNKLIESRWAKPLSRPYILMNLVDEWAYNISDPTNSFSRSNFNPNSSNLVEDICNYPGFGSVFTLVETMGECVLHSLHFHNLIGANSPLTLIRLSGLRINKKNILPSSHLVTCHTSFKFINRKVITWKGEAYQDDKIIAQTSGTSALLNN